VLIAGPLAEGVVRPTLVRVVAVLPGHPRRWEGKRRHVKPRDLLPRSGPLAEPRASEVWGWDRTRPSVVQPTPVTLCGLWVVNLSSSRCLAEITQKHGPQISTSDNKELCPKKDFQEQVFMVMCFLIPREEIQPRTNYNCTSED
jgi:hypothetical protein